MFSRKSGDLLILRDFLAFSCLYLLCVFIFCHVCLFWSVAHLGEERGGSHRAICYFEGRLRKDLNIQYRIIVFIIIIIITIFIIICCYGRRPREDLNVNQLNFPAMVPPPNCEFGIVNKVRFKDYSPRGSMLMMPNCNKMRAHCLGSPRKDPGG